MLQETEDKLRDLTIHAWDGELSWAQIESWTQNFVGLSVAQADEIEHAGFALTRFMYFGHRLVRELLRALYRDHFRAPMLQRIRRNVGGWASLSLLEQAYDKELFSTRFLGVGNPAESGAHLLYYFRQVNYLPTELFADFNGAFAPQVNRVTKEVTYVRRDARASRFVFFDDLVGSGVQSTTYLASELKRIRDAEPGLDIRFMSLFATSKGLQRLNQADMFDGKASCVFELDESYKAFDVSSRYFVGAPGWFSKATFEALARTYGQLLQPRRPVGYRDGQLLLGFSHNTPDNTLPIFWDEGERRPWFAVFPRFDKK